jgi:hypothetical protein
MKTEMVLALKTTVNKTAVSHAYFNKTDLLNLNLLNKDSREIFFDALAKEEFLRNSYENPKLIELAPDRIKNNKDFILEFINKYRVVNRRKFLKQNGSELDIGSI